MVGALRVGLPDHRAVVRLRRRQLADDALDESAGSEDARVRSPLEYPRHERSNTWSAEQQPEASIGQLRQPLGGMPFARRNQVRFFGGELDLDIVRPVRIG